MSSDDIMLLDDDHNAYPIDVKNIYQKEVTYWLKVLIPQAFNWW